MRHSLLGAWLALLAAVHGAGAVPTKTEPQRGTVYAADGTPAAGAVVWAAKLDHGPLERSETTADAQGRYSLDLAPGQWCLSARRGTQGGEGPARHETVEIMSGREPKAVEIRLHERGTLRGRLLEAETSKPIAGGQLYLDAGLVLRADDDGRFQTGGLARGGHESFVVAPGRMRLRVLFDTTARADIELDVRVPRAGRIVGRVTDLDGKPIAGAHVGRATSGSYFSLNGLYLACDAEGRFAYDDAVPPDQPTRLTAAAPGYVEEQRDGLLVPADGKPLELHFRLRPKPGGPVAAGNAEDEKRRVVTGLVRGTDAQPVPGVLVRWGHAPHRGALETRTGEDGRFRLNVPDQAGLLAVLPRELAPAFVRIPVGGEQDRVVRLRAGHTARGQIVDDLNEPLPGVRVIPVVPCPDPAFCNPHWLEEAAVLTDARGIFTLKGIPAGARFDFLKPGLSDVRSRGLDLDGAANTVTMQYGGAVRGRVVDRDGQPIRNFRVLVNFPLKRKAGEEPASCFAGYCGMGVHFTSGDGSFVLSGVGAGSVYRLMAIADGHGEAVVDRVAAVPINRLANAEPVTLRTGPPVALRVRAVAADGKPIGSARVTLVNGEPALDKAFAWGYHDASWEDMVRGRTGTDGWADFAALSFGGATVLVQAPGWARQRLGWRNGQKELTVTLAPEAALTGQVRDKAGRPAAAFYVNASSGGDQIGVSVVPDAQGRFRLAGLPAGRWAVVVRGSDGQSALYEGEVTLRAGETKQMEVEAK